MSGIGTYERYLPTWAKSTKRGPIEGAAVLLGQRSSRRRYVMHVIAGRNGTMSLRPGCETHEGPSWLAVTPVRTKSPTVSSRDGSSIGWQILHALGHCSAVFRIEITVNADRGERLSEGHARMVRAGNRRR